MQVYRIYSDVSNPFSKFKIRIGIKIFDLFSGTKSEFLNPEFYAEILRDSSEQWFR